MEKYIIYNQETGEIYMTCYNSFSAMCNFAFYKSQYGENVRVSGKQ